MLLLLVLALVGTLGILAVELGTDSRDGYGADVRAGDHGPRSRR